MLWKKLFLVSSFFILGFGCAKAPEFLLDIKMYYGDAGTQSVQGSEENIKCSEERFNSLVCMDVSEPKKIVKKVDDIINQCQTWKPNAQALEAQKQLHTWAEQER